MATIGPLGYTTGLSNDRPAASEAPVITHPQTQWWRRHRLTGLLPSLCLLAGCLAEAPEGLAPAGDATVTVELDFRYRPLPRIPLPNDLATRHDGKSATGRRLNASMVAATGFERLTRQLVDELDGWGVFAPVTIPFTDDIDPLEVVKRHHGDDYDFTDDVLYIIDITDGSPTRGQPVALDIGNGNFPVVLERLDAFWEADSRGHTNSLVFEETDEDDNGNGVLDEGEDEDLDGVLDKPNYLPGSTTKTVAAMNLAERADALMTFYERETHTLIARPLQPMRERTTYAVVVTRRLLDAAGQPVGSPYAWINHLGQNKALAPLAGILAADSDTFGGLKLADVAFTWTFTTGSMTADLRAVRDGLYGHGPQKHLATEFPADLARLYRTWDDQPEKSWETPYILSSETFIEINEVMELMSMKGAHGARLAEAGKYVDFHVLGSYMSPQLMRRVDDKGQILGYNEMTWPADVHRRKVAARPEKVTFWLTVPRKESSARKDGKPAPLAIIGHGYTSSNFEVLVYHAFFARHGIACLSIDNVSHGLVLPSEYRAIAPIFLQGKGMSGIAEGLLANRSWDQDADGVEDTGADFWTAYTFHTRDNVRQTTVDYMQLIRMIRTWDGKKTWPAAADADVDGDGKGGDIAGDFDGDGKVDVGGPDGLITMTGSSLGGIMSAMVGATEPQVAAVVPIAGGAGLGDVGIRSIQGGVKEAVELRMMGPIYIGMRQEMSGKAAEDIVVHTVVPKLNDDGRFEVGRVPAATAAKLMAGGSVYAENLANGEYDCALVRPDGSFRVHLASDVVPVDVLPEELQGSKLDASQEKKKAKLQKSIDAQKTQRQRHVLSFYEGNVFESGVIDKERHRACKRKPGVTPLFVLDEFSQDIDFHYQSRAQHYAAGDALAPLAEGLGLHRARPEIRRFLGFAQMVLDAGDPASYAPFMRSKELSYATGETVDTHVIVWHNAGDMNVPPSTGASIARCAGLLDWSKPVAGWGGRTLNQTLIDGFVLEGVDKIPRFVNPDGVGVLLDPEDLSQSAMLTDKSIDVLSAPSGTLFAKGHDAWHLPRLSPPLHSQAIVDDSSGGKSGLFMPMVTPDGRHDPIQPGEDTDRRRKACKKKPGADAAKCDATEYFDQGALVYEMLAYYLASGGKRFSLDACQVDWTCKDIVKAPPERK